jgi:hypothetical protein
MQLTARANETVQKAKAPLPLDTLSDAVMGHARRKAKQLRGEPVTRTVGFHLEGGSPRFLVLPSCIHEAASSRGTNGAKLSSVRRNCGGLKAALFGSVVIVVLAPGQFLGWGIMREFSG